ncbi:MAG: T9SS C-terminal target domain-containing protein [Saprospirales bacterium]|nr:MAG: T9SS C-terminal target domain-containing protein [Saprospirales bacterium]
MVNLTIGFSQEFIEWHPTSLESLGFDINQGILSKPFCSHAENSILFRVNADEKENPNYDPFDLESTTYEVSYLFVVNSRTPDYSFEHIISTEQLWEGHNISINYLGHKVLSDPPTDFYAYFFNITETFEFPNNAEEIWWGYGQFETFIIQNTINRSIFSQKLVFEFQSGPIDGFDLNSFTIEDLYELELLGGLPHHFSSRRHILIDGATTPQNLSDFVYDELYPVAEEPFMLPHQDAACLKEEGLGYTNNLMVLGDLVVDIDYCFINDVGFAHTTPKVWPNDVSSGTHRFIYMGPDARLIIKSGVTFTMDRTIITSCDTLWNSIVVEEGAILNIHDSYIRDGIHSIHVEPGGTVNVSTNIFDGNYVSFYTAPNTGSGRYSINMGPFYGNEFIHENGLFDFPDGYSSLESELPYAAVHIHDLMHFTAGGVGPAGQVLPNTIKDIPLGVHAVNSGVFIQNYSITNAYINDDQGYGGIGILLEQTTGIPSQIRNGVIVNAEEAGINMNNGFNIVRENSIVGCPIGVWLTQTSLGINNVSNNHISAEDFGILHNSVAGGYLNILNNEIFMESASPPPPGQNNYGIALFGFGYTGSGGRFIENNDILIRSNSQKGIYANSVSHLRIRENSVVDLSDNVDYLGIALINSPFGLVDYNTTDRPTLATVNSTGLLLRDSHSARVNCNQTEYTRYGMQVIGGSENSELKGNEIGIHQDFGLLYGFGGQGNQTTPHITGIQRHHGNIWDTYYEISAPSGVLGARHMNDIPQLFNESRFFVDSDEDPDFITTRYPVTWFFDQTFGNSWGCPQGRPESPWYDFNPRSTPTDWDRLLVNDFETFDSNPFYDSWKNISRRNLYEQIQKGQYQSTALIGTALDTFLQDVSTSNIATLYQVRETLSNALDLDSTAWMVVEEKSDSIFTWVWALFELDSVAWVDTNSVDTTQWLTDRLALLATIQQVSENLDQYLANHAPDISVIGSQAQTTLNTITAEEAPEAYEAQMLHLIAGSVFRGQWSFSQSDLDLIEDISDLCPAFGGPAVYWARNIRLTYEPDVIYNDTLCTDTWNQRVIRPEAEKLEAQIRVFPNPASSKISVDISEMDFERWVIFSIDGKLVAEGRNESGQLLSISTYGMESGQYFLKLSGKDPTRTVSFIVQNNIR